MSIEVDIKKHAIRTYPLECVGYVLDGKYFELENIASVPELRYQLQTKDKLMLLNLGKSLQALVHSHTILDNNPSETDLGAQKATQFNFWIVGTDGIQTTDIKEINL